MNNLKFHSVFVIILFLSGVMFAELAKKFRYDINNRWIYDIGWKMNFILGFASFFYSLIILIFLLKKDVNLKIKYKFFWIALSLAPILILVIGMIVTIIKNP